MTQPRPYQVNAIELARRWTELIRPRLFRRAQAATDPIALFIGAQPGAGKQAAARITARYGRPFVWIDSDELRKFHPQFRDIMRADPLRMAVLTNQAASTWVQMAITEARAAGYDVLIETASTHRMSSWPRRPDSKTPATPPRRRTGRPRAWRDSRLGAVHRYVDAAAAGRTARWTNLASHEAGMTGLPATVQALQNSPVIDRLTITDRAGDTHYDSQSQPGDAQTVLAAVREAPPTAELAQRWLATWIDTRNRLQQIPNLDLDQLKPLMDRLEYDAQTITPTPGYDSASARSTRADTLDRSRLRLRFSSYIAESAASHAPGKPVTTVIGAKPNEPETPAWSRAVLIRRTRRSAASCPPRVTMIPNSSAPSRASTSPDRTVDSSTLAVSRR